MVGGTHGDLARAGGAGTRAAGVGEVNASLLLVRRVGVWGRGLGQRSVPGTGWCGIIGKPCDDRPIPRSGFVTGGVRSRARVASRAAIRRARLDTVSDTMGSWTHLSGVEDVGVVGAGDVLLALGGLEGDGEGLDLHAAGLGDSLVAADGNLAAGEGGAGHGGGGEGESGHFCYWRECYVL